MTDPTGISNADYERFRRNLQAPRTAYDKRCISCHRLGPPSGYLLLIGKRSTKFSKTSFLHGHCFSEQFFKRFHRYLHLLNGFVWLISQKSFFRIERAKKNEYRIFAHFGWKCVRCKYPYKLTVLLIAGDKRRMDPARVDSSGYLHGHAVSLCERCNSFVHQNVPERNRVKYFAAVLDKNDGGDLSCQGEKHSY